MSSFAWPNSGGGGTSQSGNHVSVSQGADLLISQSGKTGPSYVDIYPDGSIGQLVNLTSNSGLLPAVGSGDGITMVCTTSTDNAASGGYSGLYAGITFSGITSTTYNNYAVAGNVDVTGKFSGASVTNAGVFGGSFSDGTTIDFLATQGGNFGVLGTYSSSQNLGQLNAGVLGYGNPALNSSALNFGVAGVLSQPYPGTGSAPAYNAGVIGCVIGTNNGGYGTSAAGYFGTAFNLSSLPTTGPTFPSDQGGVAVLCTQVDTVSNSDLQRTYFGTSRYYTMQVPNSSTLSGGISGVSGSGVGFGDLTATVQTTNASATTIFTATLVNQVAFVITVDVVARQSGGSNFKAIKSMAGVSCESGTAALMTSSPITIATVGDASWGSVTWAVSTNVVSVKVTGITSTTINWSAHISYNSVT